VLQKKVTENFYGSEASQSVPARHSGEGNLEARALESEEGKVIGSGPFDYALEEVSWAFELSFVGL